MIVAVGPGGRSGEYIQIRIPMSAVPELRGLLKAEGVPTTFTIQESADVQELTGLVVSIAGGVTTVVGVLNAFLRRHRDKSLLVERDGTRYELKGMSLDDMERLLSRVVDKAADEQRETEHLYRGIPGADDDLDAQ